LFHPPAGVSFPQEDPVADRISLLPQQLGEIGGVWTERPWRAEDLAAVRSVDDLDFGRGKIQGGNESVSHGLFHPFDFRDISRASISAISMACS
jgi:hypothetical protein